MILKVIRDLCLGNARSACTCYSRGSSSCRCWWVLVSIINFCRGLWALQLFALMIRRILRSVAIVSIDWGRVPMGEIPRRRSVNSHSVLVLRKDIVKRALHLLMMSKLVCHEMLCGWRCISTSDWPLIVNLLLLLHNVLLLSSSLRIIQRIPLLSEALNGRLRIVAEHQ